MIGFFDSGKGGLTTLTDCINGGLRGEIVYYADYENAPFGNKSKGDLNVIGSNIVEKLKSFGANVFVCACNTLSLACDFKKEWNVITLRTPFELIDNYSSCLFLGTDFSVNALPKWFFELGGKALALPQLATLIDETDLSAYNESEKQDQTKNKNISSEKLQTKSFANEKIMKYLDDNLKEEAETVILGCTHYKFVKNEIKTRTHAKKILSINEGAIQKLKSFKGDNVIVYVQREKYEDYSSALLSLTNKPIVKPYDT